MAGAEVLEWKMSKVRGGQIIDVLSSHNKELCHVDELKNLANFFFLKPMVAWEKNCLHGVEVMQL